MNLPITKSWNWTVLHFLEKRRHKPYYLCRCVCGTERALDIYTLNKGSSHSCGCLTSKRISQQMGGHGMSYTSTYSSWNSMRDRCANPANKDYPSYGGRGIQLSDDWLSFDNFLKDMGEKPEGYQIDRIDNTKGYNKENCRWASNKENMRNRTTSITIYHKGKQLYLQDIVDKTGRTYKSLYYQLITANKSLEDVLTNQELERF